MNLVKLYVLLLFLLCSVVAVAQDVQFTQQYANRLTLNPAYTGLNYNWRVTLAHRNQWPTLNGSFKTNQAAADVSLPDNRGAVGLILQHDRAGIGGLQKLEATAGYAYHTSLSSELAFSGGLQVSVASLRVNTDNLVFGDQLSDFGLIALTSAEAKNFEPSTYASVTAGGLIYTDQLWFGLTVKNLNRPAHGWKESSRLPMRYIANAGYKFYVASYETINGMMEFSISPSVTFAHQENFNRTDAGVYTKYTPLTFGLIYKGVPVAGNPEQDKALAVLAGLQLKQFEIGFSHDIGLSGISKQSGGANEITVTLRNVSFNRSSERNPKNKYNRVIFCPAF
jgi:type IX secretion system PorP/SprF family membrane protein